MQNGSSNTLRKINFGGIFNLFLILLLLYFGKILFVPLAFSVFISFLLYPICKWLEEKGIRSPFSIIISLFVLSIPVIFLVGVILNQLFLIKEQIPELQTKIPITISKLYMHISDILGISVEKLQTVFRQAVIKSFDFMSIIKGALELSSSSVVLMVLIPIYTFLLLYYRKNYVKFLLSLYPDTDKNLILSILKETVHTYFKFIKGMIIIYMIVGILNSIGLYLFNIPSPFFWGFLASILTIIPYVGIIIGTIIPISISFITYNSIWYPIGIILVYTFVQILEAYLIFPLVVGKRLELNPLIILLAIIGGGIVWGVAGMILFIPALGILKLISEKISWMKPINIVIGRT